MKPELKLPRRALLLLTIAGLASCAGLGGPPTVTLKADDIQSLVQKSFPQERRLLEVLDVSVAAPATRLLPERNRIGAVIQIQARDRLFGATWKGRLDFDAALRWEPRDQTVRLTQVRVQDLASDAASPVRTPAERLGLAVTERVLEDLSLYQLGGERAQQMQRLGVMPSAITVTSRGVEITFQPQPR